MEGEGRERRRRRKVWEGKKREERGKKRRRRGEEGGEGCGKGGEVAYQPSRLHTVPDQEMI